MRPLAMRPPSWTSAVMLAAAAVAALALGALATAYDVRLGLVLALAMPGAALAWARPMVAGVVMIAVAPVVSGLGRGVPVPGLKVSEVLAVGGGALLLLAADHRTDTRWRALDWAGLAYVLAHLGIGAVWTVTHDRPLDTGILGVLVGPAQFFIMYRALVVTLQTAERRRLALRAVLYASLVVSFLAVAEAAFPPLSLALRSLTSDPDFAGANYSSLNRVTRPFAHFQVLSAYLASILILGTALLADRGRALMPKSHLLVVMGLAAVALTLTVTITTILGTIVAVLLLIVRYRRALLVPAVGLLVALGIAFSPLLVIRYQDQTAVSVGTVAGQRNPLLPQTLAYRIDVWTTQSIPVVRRNLLTGVGPVLPQTVAWRSTESMYFTLLFRGGVPLLAAWLVMVGAMLVSARRLREAEDPTVRVAARALFGLMSVLVIMQFIQPYMTYGGVTHVVWLLAAIVAVGGLQCDATAAQEAL